MNSMDWIIVGIVISTDVIGWGMAIVFLIIVIREKNENVFRR